MRDDPGNKRAKYDLILMVGGFLPAFLVAAAFLYPHLSYFRQTTDDEGTTLAAYLTACAILAGAWPGVIFVVLGIVRFARHRAKSRTDDTPP